MDSYYIALCRLCGKKMKRYGMCVYPGDSSCCQQCNDEVNKEVRNNPWKRNINNG